jgi:hypothetical protein
LVNGRKVERGGGILFFDQVPGVGADIAAGIEAHEVAGERNLFLDLVVRYAAFDLLADQGAVALLAFVLGAESVAGVGIHGSSLRTKTGVRL